jgi:4-amino-4-deoxychorismate lyase
LRNNFLINGSFTKNISPFDRGLSFGDGVFRTFLVKNGYPLNWELHYKKLENDGKNFQIKIPTQKKLLIDIKKLFNINKIYIGKIIITRGISKQGYQFKKNLKSTCILLKITHKKINDKFYSDGVKLEICKTRVSDNELFKGAKHLNRIDNVLAKAELSKSAFDGLMLDKNGYINECASSNIFARYGKIIITPKQLNAGVSGVCKQIIINNSNMLGFKFKEQDIKLLKLKNADEVFITNSIFGALYVNQIEEKRWKKSLCTSLIRNLILGR